MKMNRGLSYAAVLGLGAWLAIAARADGAMGHGGNLADMKFASIPGLPACATAAVESGDPSKEASVILATAAAGCTFPWHWHTPNEHVMMVKGTARAEMKSAAPVTLQAGGYILMPARHVHRFQCLEPCTLFIYSDTAFDIHYVDEQGKEIPADEALKVVGEVTLKLEK